MRGIDEWHLEESAEYILERTSAAQAGSPGGPEQIEQDFPRDSTNLFSAESVAVAQANKSSLVSLLESSVVDDSRAHVVRCPRSTFVRRLLSFSSHICGPSVALQLPFGSPGLIYSGSLVPAICAFDGTPFGRIPGSSWRDVRAEPKRPPEGHQKLHRM